MGNLYKPSGTVNGVARSEKLEGTFVDMFEKRVQSTPDQTAFTRSIAGQWQAMSWAELDDLTNQLAHGLISIGMQPGQRVAILSRSRAEWFQADLAIQKAGGCTVPVHVDAVVEHVRHVLADSGARIAFVQDEKQLAKVRQVIDQTSLDQVILMGGPANGSVEVRWTDLLAAGRVHKAEFPGTLASRKAQIGCDSLASIVYTAGTTGLPKGVMLTHDNIVFEAEALAKVMEHIVANGDIHLLCLPLSHILARIMVLASVRVGYCTAFSSGLDMLNREMIEVRPAFVTVVPGILERIHGALAREVEKRGWAVRKLFRWATEVGEQVASRRSQSAPIPLGLSLMRTVSDRVIIGPAIKQRFGGRLKFFVSGGAPLSTEIAEFLNNLGILVLEGYGMTENVGAANVNRPDRYRIGTVGPPIPGIEERLADDGEILIRGRNVMAGYHGQPEATAEVIDQDGWLHTGDIGKFDREGFLQVTDRKKNIIVTSGGKNVSPQNIEKLMRTSSYIDNLMVCGDGRKHLTALVSLDREQIQRFAEREGIPFDRLSELAVHPRVRKLIEDEIEERNRQLPGYETIRRFTILPEPFSLDAGEITPTLKLRRKEVEERYRETIEAMYAEQTEKTDEIFLGER